MVKKIVILILWLGVLSFGFANDNAKSSPVVQVVSYKQIFGNNVQMLGWGSASIIDNNWIIITNNHVVDNWDWWIADIFNICVSNNIWDKPDCNYTASLLARDKLMDIAMLKIDATTVKWEKVDYNNFSSFEVDYDYLPNIQDDIITIGFPWIGSETISQTKWIVSWISKYNNYNYIKTDAMIAWGNSWWAMINNKWKLIWIPTFLIWWYQSWNMWYALLISEAKSFIKSNITKKPISLPLEIDFLSYKNKIDTINQNLFIEDDIFRIAIPKEYEVKNYYDNRKIEISPRKDSSYLVTSFSAYVQSIPTVTTEKELFYLLELLWFYNKLTDNLKKDQIGWLTFYSAISKKDLNYWLQETERLYVWKINDTNLMVVKLQLNITQDKELNKKVDNELVRLLEWVVFNTKNDDKIVTNFNLKSPKVQILDLTNSYVDEFNWWIVKFFGKLYEWYYIMLNQLTLEDWKWKSVSEIYKIKTADITIENKSMIKFKWHDWFIVCKNDTFSSIDENWNKINLKECKISVFGWFVEPNWNEYYLQFSLIAKSDEIQWKFKAFIDYIDKNIVINLEWEWQTNIPNILVDSIGLKFIDLWFQTKDYKQMLQILVKYKLIPNSLYLDPYKPLKWWEYVYMYTQMVYGFDYSKSSKFCKNPVCNFLRYDLTINDKKKNLYLLLSQLNLPFDEYVDYDKAQDLPIILDMIFAWINPSDINEELIAYYFENSTDEYFSQINQQLNNLKNKYFGSKKIDITYMLPFGADFFPSKLNYFIDDKIITIDLYNKQKYPFSSVSTNTENPHCSNTKSCYPVLSKWQAIDIIVKNIDFAMYDKSLLEKKDTVLYNEFEDAY